MAQLQCYMMVVTAELMLAVGRQADGINYLLSALVILRETKVGKELTAAIELLRKAVATEPVPSRLAVENFRSALGRVLNIRPVK